MKFGIHETTHITNTIENYINTSFEESLSSKNPIFKAFALIDRHLGKRRFDQIVLEENEHPLLKIYYGLKKEYLKINKKENPPTMTRAGNSYNMHLVLTGVERNVVKHCMLKVIS